MAERGVPFHEVRYPTAFREDTATRIYTTPYEEVGPHVKYDLSQGFEPFGLPPYIDEVINSMYEGDQIKKALGGYGKVNLAEAREFNYKWHGMDQSRSHFSFGNRGSYGALMDVLTNLVKAPNQGKVKFMGTNLDFIATRKAANRFETHFDSKLKIPFYSLPNKLTATQDEVLENAIESVRSFGKKGMKNFVVTYTDSSSPKGDSSTNKKRIEELAYQCAKYYYALLIDQVPRPIQRPSDSSGYLTSEYPVIVFDSLSKIIGLPGARQGQIMMPKIFEKPFEGIKTEYEFDGLDALFAKEYYKFKYEHDQREWIQFTTESSETTKRPFVDELSKRKITVYPTDMRVPFFFVAGKDEGFCERLEQLGIRVARGNKGFNETYNTPMTDLNYNKAVLTGQFARVTTVPSLRDISPVVDIFEKAYEYAA